MFVNLVEHVTGIYLDKKEEVSDEKKSCSLKIKVSKILLSFKDKESESSKSV